jgi:hypothetical protein
VWGAGVQQSFCWTDLKSAFNLIYMLFNLIYFILFSACRESSIYCFRPLQEPFTTPQERKAGKDDRGQIFQAGDAHAKVIF